MRKTIFLGSVAFVNAAFLLLQLLAMGSLGSCFEFPILSLAVPLLFFINISFFIFWLIRFQWPLLMIVLLFMIGYEELQLLYQFDDNGFSAENGVSVMSYNVRSFNRFKWINSINIPDKIERFINKEDPDIICFQEYSKKESPNFKNYPYKIFKPYVGSGQIGLCIISKLPLFNSKTINFTASTNGGLYANFLWKKDTIRIYNVHFESVRIDFKDTLIASKYSQKFRRKINETFKIQKTQVSQFNSINNENDHPEIICTDLNNNAFSEVYLNLKKGRKDAFLKKGMGFGATYNFLYFPLRIDFIMTNPKANILSYKTHEVKLSDHKPISAIIKLP